MKRKILSVTMCSLLGVSSAYGDDLMQVYEAALENDAQIRAARATRNSTLEEKPQAVAQLLPTIGLSADANRVNRDIEDAGGSSSTYENSSAKLSLNQPIYRHEYWVQLEQADQQVAKAEAEYAAAEQELMVRTAQAYFDVLSAQDSLEFAKAETEAISRQLDQAKQRFDVGLIAITDVHEAQAAYDQSRADLIAAENVLDDAWEALREIVKQKPASLSVLAEDLPLNSPVPESIEEWSNRAQQQNLSIRAADKDAAIARENISLQRAGHFPTLDLVGSHTVSRTDLDTGTDVDTSSIGVQLNLPLFAGGSVLSRTRQAEYDLEAAQEGLDAQRRSVERQVRDAYRGVLASISQVEALKASTVSAQSALEATEAGFEVGTRTMVDVLSAQRDLYQTRSNYSNVRYNYILSGLLLKQATGILSQEDLKQVNSWLR
jgi:outer membrane protein